MTPPSLTERLAAALPPRYRLERELGSGGMATVYLAHDEKHNRPVALKVLRPELAAIIGAERFLAEIEVTASLQHPHILPLFDSGEAEGFLYYVMPVVEGESLQDLLERERQLPIEDAVRIGVEVADALDYAHRQGIIHRDVKPANVLLHEGRVLVADFGIALAVRQAGGERLTETGLSMGTPHYMSPEQAAADRDPDARSDVYSLGAMVYEMLAGRPPHTGTSLQSVVASVLTRTPPPVDEDRPSIPAGVAAAVHKAIERLPADRYQTAAAFRTALEDPSTDAGRDRRSRGGRPLAKRERAAWAGAVAVLVAAVALVRLTGSGGEEETRAPGARFVLEVPFVSVQGEERRVTISSDGSRILAATRSQDQGYLQLFERDLDGLEFTPAAPEMFGTGAVFSPEDDYVAYMENTDAMIVNLRQGSTREIPVGSGAFGWDEDDRLYIGVPGGIIRASPESGTADTILSVDPEGVASGRLPNAPRPLPGGRQLLYHAFVSSVDRPDLMAHDLETGKARLLIPGASSATYLPFGVLVYQRPDGTLEGVRFDPESLEPAGEPRLLESGLRWDIDLDAGYAVSRNGVLVYERATLQDIDPVWVEPGGDERELPPSFPDAAIMDVEFSPDGSRLAYVVVDGSYQHIWIYDFEQDTHSRLTVVDAVNDRPTWTRDGTRISFVSDRDSLRAIYTRPVDGSSPATLEVASNRLVQQVTWRDDGALIYREGYTDPGTQRDLLYRLPGDTISRAFVVTDFDELAPTFSPDGNWVAYVSNESREDEIHLRPFPGPGGRVTVSVNGGREPAWSADGTTLYYRSGADSLVAARLAFEDGEARVRAREFLFSTAGYQPFRNDRNYTVVPGEERFIFLRPPDTVELVVVTDWFDRVRSVFGIER